MPKAIQILEELGAEEKSLLLELPRHLLEKIDIAIDGTVNTQQLLQILIRHYQEHPEHEKEDLLTNILDRSRAVTER